CRTTVVAETATTTLSTGDPQSVPIVALAGQPHIPMFLEGWGETITADGIWGETGIIPGPSRDFISVAPRRGMEPYHVPSRRLDGPRVHNGIKRKGMSAPRQMLRVAAWLACTTGTALAQSVAERAQPVSERGREPLEEVVIIAPYGTVIDRDRIPAMTQSATAEQIALAQPLDLTDFLNRNFSSVNINHAQNNPLQ